LHFLYGLYLVGMKRPLFSQLHRAVDLAESMTHSIDEAIASLRVSHRIKRRRVRLGIIEWTGSVCKHPVCVQLKVVAADSKAKSARLVTVSTSWVDLDLHAFDKWSAGKVVAETKMRLMTPGSSRRYA